MEPTTFDERYVAAAAAAIGLDIPSGHEAAVAENLRRIAVIAAQLLDMTLELEDEIAPVWRPE